MPIGWAPPPPAGPVAGRGERFGARLLDLLIAGACCVAVLIALGDGERPTGGLVLIWATLTAYEALTPLLFGTTPGKAMVGLRVVGLDHVGRPPVGQLARRGAAGSALIAVPVIGWAVWAVSTLADPLGRGVADRAGRTMVVPRHARLPIATRDLAGYADGARRPRLSALGRVGDLDVRARARLRRLADAPLLVILVGVLALVAALPLDTPMYVLVTSAVWVVAFVVDETVRIHRHGATAGHRMAGLVVRNRRTGSPPSTGRSLARALVLGLTLYVPVLWPLLAISLLMMRWSKTGRGLHDLAGGTLVVGDPALGGEEQRQRAMRMRLGQAA